MPLDEGLQPREAIPKCIVVRPWKGVALNAVGLSNPGAEAYLERVVALSSSRAMGDPFMMSFMAVHPERPERLAEIISFDATLRKYIRLLRHRKFGIQINLSCPNVGLDPAGLLKEGQQALTILGQHKVPLLVKINALVPPDVAVELAAHPACDGLVCSNTIPWGKMADKIPWKKLFGTETSPLASLGGGGLSGKPLLPIVRDWVYAARGSGFKKAIVAGGGVLSKADADSLLDVGADAIELGSISMLRPWRVHGVIQQINQRFEHGVDPYTTTESTTP
jgi:dihydroorotate dehydrogenase